MSQFGGGASKNPPWVRQTQSMGMGVSQQNQLQPQMMTQIGNTAMLQYPQAQMFQQSQLGQLQQPGMAMQTMGAMGTNQIAAAGGLSASIQPTANAMQQQQLYPQVGNVSYPTRTLIATPFGSNSGMQAGSVSNSNSGSSSNSSNTPKQRVFTGTVTKVQDNFGFVDEEVFFQTSCCVKGSNPQVGDRVLVEAMYNASMPFKWNATRIQVLPMERSNEPIHSVVGRGRFTSSYNNVPPPTDDIMSGGGSDFGRRNRGVVGGNKRNRRDDDDFERKRRREDRRSNERNREEKEKEKDKEKEKERPKSPPPRKRSKTPRRRKTRVVPRYMVQIPKLALDMPESDVLEIKKRYTNMYVPSDFFLSSFKWVEVFPPHRPLTLERPCAFHVMHKDVDPVVENDAALDPPDADYLFCAKVMLLSMPELDEIYKKCCALADDKEGSHDDYSRDFVHPTRLINFLVGLRGKNETMAIGGPWSLSLDGPNPDKDPTVLIKTAIRNCNALTGIDLTNCSQWYRFLEIYYHRAETVHKGKTIPARVETVVLYLPDVWNCLPTRLEWDGLHLNYKKQLDRLLNHDEEAEGDDKDVSSSEIQKKEPTHYSQLDPKVMKVNELREELEARSLSPKGLKSQLTARLAKALKSEQDKEEEETAAKNEAGKGGAKNEKEEKEEERKKKEEEEKKKLDEKDKQLMEKRYTLPEKSHIVVHPSRVAKSGKFDCTVMSLSLLLDYRPEDSKEHSFEVSLFAELFNEMLMRDFGFCIYKSLMEAPEKAKEEKEDRSKDKDKKSDKERRDHDDKKDDKNSIEDDDGSDDDDSKKDKRDVDKKKKERVKLVTVDPYLLLAFVYFDQTHCGYIFDKDIEELLFTLGLNLSRAQVKKLVQKVVSRDSLHYRKLTDKPKDEPIKQNGNQSTEDIINLALGNKRLFPVFDDGFSPNKRNKKESSDKKTDSELPSGFVMYNGSLLDINKLQAQFKRSEDSRLKTEKILEKLRSEFGNLKDTNNRNMSSIKRLTSELKDFKERLTNTNSELCNMDGKTKLYFSVMSEIYEKLTPIIIQKQNSGKEEVIEDVEMEDVMENTDEKQTSHIDYKKESDVKIESKSLGSKEEQKSDCFVKNVSETKPTVEKNNEVSTKVVGEQKSSDHKNIDKASIEPSPKELKPTNKLDTTENSSSKQTVSEKVSNSPKSQIEGKEATEKSKLGENSVKLESCKDIKPIDKDVSAKTSEIKQEEKQSLQTNDEKNGQTIKSQDNKQEENKTPTKK